jgi:hypothetical protein
VALNPPYDLSMRRPALPAITAWLMVIGIGAAMIVLYLASDNKWSYPTQRLLSGGLLVIAIALVGLVVMFVRALKRHQETRRRKV